MGITEYVNSYRSWFFLSRKISVQRGRKRFVSLLFISNCPPENENEQFMSKTKGNITEKKLKPKFFCFSQSSAPRGKPMSQKVQAMNFCTKTPSFLTFSGKYQFHWSLYQQRFLRAWLEFLNKTTERPRHQHKISRGFGSSQRQEGLQSFFTPGPWAQQAPFPPQHSPAQIPDN